MNKLILFLALIVVSLANAHPHSPSPPPNQPVTADDNTQVEEQSWYEYIITYFYGNGQTDTVVIYDHTGQSLDQILSFSNQIEEQIHEMQEEENQQQKQLEMQEEEEDLYYDEDKEDVEDKAAVETDEDKAAGTAETNCYDLIVNAYNTCEQKRCDYVHDCHKKHNKKAEDDKKQNKKAEDDKKQNKKPDFMVSKDCKKLTDEALNQLDQCKDVLIESDLNQDLYFEDAINYLVEFNKEVCSCGFLCQNDFYIFILIGLCTFIMWLSIYIKLCKKHIDSKKHGCCKSTLIGILLLPVSMFILFCINFVASIILINPIFSLPIIFGVTALLILNKRRLLRLRQQQLLNNQNNDRVFVASEVLNHEANPIIIATPVTNGSINEKEVVIATVV